jgi:drug/metabolite transporter (DMT)-like permease
MPGHRHGAILVLLAAVLWSSGGLGIKNLDIPALATAGWRSFFAIPVLLAFGGIRYLRPAVVRQPAVIPTGVACMLTICLFVAANRLTTAANAILLQYTSPVWVILLSFPVLHEKPHRRDYMLAAACLSGLVFFFLDELSLDGMLGNLLAVITGMTMACMIVGLRFQGLRGKQSPALLSILLGNMLCMAVCSPWMIVALPAMGAREWGILAALGSLQIGISYVFFSAGLRYVSALRATLLGLVEPLLNPVWVALGKGEIPGAGAVAGGIIILVSLVADALTRNQRRPTR